DSWNHPQDFDLIAGIDLGGPCRDQGIALGRAETAYRVGNALRLDSGGTAQLRSMLENDRDDLDPSCGGAPTYRGHRAQGRAQHVAVALHGTQARTHEQLETHRGAHRVARQGE